MIVRTGQRGAGGAAFTLVELTVSMSASIMILGALMMSSISFQRALQSSEKYAGAYSDQRRLTDYLGRDLRRAVGLAYTDAAGVRGAVGGAPAILSLDGQATLIVTLPGYYQSQTRSDAAYAERLEVVGDGDRLDYGTAAGLAPTVEVVYRKIYSAQEGCVCVLRQEAGVEEVIVRQADDLTAQVTVAGDAQSCQIATFYRAAGTGPAPLVSTFDRLLLRNPPLDFRP